MASRNRDAERKRILKSTMDQYKRSGLFDAVRKEVVAEIMTNDSLKEKIFVDCEGVIKSVLSTVNPRNSTLGVANQRLKHQLASRPVRRGSSLVEKVKTSIDSSLEAHTHIDDVERLVRKAMGLPERREVEACDPPPPPAPPVLPPLEDAPLSSMPPPPPPPQFPKIDFEAEPSTSDTVPIEDSFESVDDTLEDSQEEVLMEVSDGEEEWKHERQQVKADSPPAERSEGILNVAKSEHVVESVVPVSENIPANDNQAVSTGRSKRQPKKRTDDSYLYY